MTESLAVPADVAGAAPPLPVAPSPQQLGVLIDWSAA